MSTVAPINEQNLESQQADRMINIAGYLFVTLDRLEERKAHLLVRTRSVPMKGKIILSPEGINLFLAGPKNVVKTFLDELRADPKLAGLEVKYSLSAYQPFRRMLVKVKQEIITMRRPAIIPESGRAPAVESKQLKSWLDHGVDDEGRPVVLLDTRNTFEVEAGTFVSAQHLNLERFSQFPDAVEQQRDALRGKRIVTFCTGGIRCEKAALFMQQVGFEHVTQLEGGILKYFEEVGGDHYTGNCFVFDERVALDPSLHPQIDQPVQTFAPNQNLLGW